MVKNMLIRRRRAGPAQKCGGFAAFHAFGPVLGLVCRPGNCGLAGARRPRHSAAAVPGDSAEKPLPMPLRTDQDCRLRPFGLAPRLDVIAA